MNPPGYDPNYPDADYQAITRTCAKLQAERNGHRGEFNMKRRNRRDLILLTAAGLIVGLLSGSILAGLAAGIAVGFFLLMTSEPPAH